jgi:hypothetical protein
MTGAEISQKSINVHASCSKFKYVHVLNALVCGCAFTRALEGTQPSRQYRLVCAVIAKLYSMEFQGAEVLPEQ